MEDFLVDTAVLGIYRVLDRRIFGKMLNTGDFPDLLFMNSNTSLFLLSILFDLHNKI